MYVHNSMSYLRDSIFFLIYCDVTSFLNTPKDLEETPLINVIFTMTLHQWKMSSIYGTFVLHTIFQAHSYFISWYLLAHGLKI